MGFAGSAMALIIVCAAGEASGSGVWRRLTRGRAQACVAWRRRAGAGREYRGAPSSARCLRAPSSQDPLSSEFRLTARHRVPTCRRCARRRPRRRATGLHEVPDRGRSRASSEARLRRSRRGASTRWRMRRQSVLRRDTSWWNTSSTWPDGHPYCYYGNRTGTNANGTRVFLGGAYNDNNRFR